MKHIPSQKSVFTFLVFLLSILFNPIKSYSQEDLSGTWEGRTSFQLWVGDITSYFKKTSDNTYTGVNVIVWKKIGEQSRTVKKLFQATLNNNTLSMHEYKFLQSIPGGVLATSEFSLVHKNGKLKLDSQHPLTQTSSDIPQEYESAINDNTNLSSPSPTPSPSPLPQNNITLEDPPTLIIDQNKLSMESEKSWEKGMALFYAEKYQDAVPYFLSASKEGYNDAAYELGLFSEFGLGVSKDAHKAELWYQYAASNGSAIALHRLALLVARGLTSRQISDYFPLDESAADASSSEAITQLYLLYKMGNPQLNVQQDDNQAQLWKSRLNKMFKTGEHILNTPLIKWKMAKAINDGVNKINNTVLLTGEVPITGYTPEEDTVQSITVTKFNAVSKAGQIDLQQPFEIECRVQFSPNPIVWPFQIDFRKINGQLYYIVIPANAAQMAILTQLEPQVKLSMGDDINVGLHELYEFNH